MWRDSDSFALMDRKRASTRSLDPTWECRLRRPCRESRAFKSLDSLPSDRPSNYLILKTPFLPAEFLIRRSQPCRSARDRDLERIPWPSYPDHEDGKEQKHQVIQSAREAAGCPFDDEAP